MREQILPSRLKQVDERSEETTLWLRLVSHRFYCASRGIKTRCSVGRVAALLHIETTGVLFLVSIRCLKATTRPTERRAPTITASSEGFEILTRRLLRLGIRRERVAGRGLGHARRQGFAHR